MNTIKEFNKEEYNKMCAEFLGCSQRELGLWNGEGKLIHSTSFLLTSDLKFDSNWNWIMEVVEKIQSTYKTEKSYGVIIEICTTHISIVVEDQDFTVDFKKTNLSKIEGLVQAIWEFLNWYNNQNK
jgi:hypothetical protein